GKRVNHPVLPGRPARPGRIRRVLCWGRSHPPVDAGDAAPRFRVVTGAKRRTFSAMIRILFIGDIVGRPGRDIVATRVARLRSKYGVDFVIANAENAAAGAGINGTIAKTLLGLGVDAITLGDHVWDQRGWDDEIASFERVCRPANL